MINLINKFKYFLQFVIISLLLLIFKLVGLNFSRSISKKILFLLGPLFRSNKITKSNISIAFPKEKENFKKKIMKEMWMTYGAILAQYNFIKKFRGKILNIHPSLLPKYKGLNTHQRALDNNEKYSGCTVHLVNNRLDSGKIILQKRVKILKKDNSQSLGKRVLKREHLIYPKAIKKVISNL